MNEQLITGSKLLPYNFVLLRLEMNRSNTQTYARLEIINRHYNKIHDVWMSFQSLGYPRINRISSARLARLSSYQNDPAIVLTGSPDELNRLFHCHYTEQPLQALFLKLIAYGQNTAPNPFYQHIIKLLTSPAESNGELLTPFMLTHHGMPTYTGKNADQKTLEWLQVAIVEATLSRQGSRVNPLRYDTVKTWLTDWITFKPALAKVMLQNGWQPDFATLEANGMIEWVCDGGALKPKLVSMKN
jgi:hypothetical protein